MILKCSELNPGGTGNVAPHEPYSYYERDINRVLDQDDADRSKGPFYMNMIVLGEYTSSYEGTIHANYNATVLVAKDSNGEFLIRPNDFVALPCPPYCGKVTK